MDTQLLRKKSITFDCCDNNKVSHTLCWSNQSDETTPVMCCNVQHYMKRNSRTPDFNVKLTGEMPELVKKKLSSLPNELYCSTCDKIVDPDDPTAKDHLKYSCEGIPSTPLRPGFSKPDLAKRMAVLGARKKLYNHNFTPHVPDDPTLVPLSPGKVVGS